MIKIAVRPQFDPSGPFAIVRRDGVLYDLGDEQVEIFTLKVLAEALGRSRDTLLAWESAGFIPAPLFRIERPPRTQHDGPWRHYSGAQIVNANRLARFHFGRRRRVDDRLIMARFAASLIRVWYTPELVGVDSLRPSAEHLES